MLDEPGISTLLIISLVLFTLTRINRILAGILAAVNRRLKNK